MLYYRRNRLPRDSSLRGTYPLVAFIRLLLPLLLTALASPSAIAATAAETDAVASDTGVCSVRYVAGDTAGDTASGATSIEADALSVNEATDTYTATGRFSIRQPGLLLKGDKATGNLSSGAASIDSASFLLHENRVRGTARRVARTADGRILVNDGTITTCEPDSNAWSLEGDEIELVTQSGYGTARDVKLRIRDLPVVWFPYLRFPIDDTRQSGFLLPSIGHDSDGGTDITIPYYFNLAPDRDLTYSLRPIAKRGIAHEAEFRHLGKRSENLIAGAYLPRDDEYEPRGRPGPGFREADRWLAHVSHRGAFGRWTSRVNYTAVSDIDYLRDLGSPASTTTGIERVSDSARAPALLRTGSLDYRRGAFRSSLELRSFRKLTQAQSAQYETVPRLTLDYSSSIAALRFDARAQATRFHRDADAPDLDPVTGARYVFDGSVSAPMRNAWGFFTPQANLVHRAYDLDDAPPGSRDDARITTGRLSIDSGLAFERTTTFLGRPALQTLEPRIHYLYAEQDFQDDLPLFDTTWTTPSYHQIFRRDRFTGYDRIGDTNRLAIGIASDISSLGPSTDAGARLMTLGIGRIVHFDDREVTAGEPGADPQASASPFFLSASANFPASLSTRLAYEWDPDESRSNRGFLSMKYRPAGNKIFNLSYSYANKAIHRPGQVRNEKELNTSFVWPLGKALSLIGRWSHALDSDQTIESLFGVEYNDCCWKTRLVFRRYLEEPRLIAVTDDTGAVTQAFDRRADSGVFLEFQLKGLGSLGGRLSSLLEDAIPGHRPL